MGESTCSSRRHAKLFLLSHCCSRGNRAYQPNPLWKPSQQRITCSVWASRWARTQSWAPSSIGSAIFPSNQLSRSIWGSDVESTTNFWYSSFQGWERSLNPDWSKEGMGFLLLQKYCIYPTEKAAVCGPEGWHVIFAGCRFYTNTEHWYAFINGEAAAITWSLEKCYIFIMGCPNVIVVTDPQPPTGIFGDRDFSKVYNPSLFRLKEKCLRYHFTIQHCPSKWHKGADAISYNPVATVEVLISLCPTHPCFNGISHHPSNNE